MSAKLKVAEEAWRQGTTFESDDFFGHRVVKSNKMVLVMAPFAWFREKFAKPHSTPKRTKDVFFCTKEDIVVFPQPRHAPLFLTASRGVRSDGPAQSNPQAVGTVCLRLYLTGKSQRLALSFAQAHFRTTNTWSWFALPRNLATYYGGWRRRALREAVKLALHLNLPLEINRGKLYPKKRSYPGGKSPLHQELVSVVNELGATVKEVQMRNSRFIVVNPAH